MEADTRTWGTPNGCRGAQHCQMTHPRNTLLPCLRIPHPAWLQQGHLHLPPEGLLRMDASRLRQAQGTPAHLVRREGYQQLVLQVQLVLLCPSVAP